VKRMNFGSAFVLPKDWVNVDLIDYGQPHVVDIRDGLPFDDGEFDYIVANHSIQMLKFGDELENGLTELCRVLKPSGTLRILVPDAYLAILRWADEPAPGLFPISPEIEPTWDGQLLRYLFWHGDARSAFTADSLLDTLCRVGFPNVQRCIFGQTRSTHSEITVLDSRQDESLIVEAVKG
jgi:SAM-dependent methyltransferase